MVPEADLKVLAFDVFGTVVDWRGGVAAEMAAIAKERHLTVDPGAFADAWRSKYLPYLLRIRNGEMPWQVLDGVHRASLQELASELSLQSLTEAVDEPQIRTFLKRQMRDVHDYFAEVIRRSQESGGVLPDRDAEAEAWIFIAGGLLITIDRRLGGLLGDDLKRVKRERKRWLLGEEAAP